MFLSQLFRRGGAIGRVKAGSSRSRAAVRRQRRSAAAIEALEPRAMLAVTVTPDAGGNELLILYNQADAFGVTATSNQSVIVEIEDIFFPFTTTRVNVYVPSNPVSIVGGAVVAPAQTYSFTGISKITAQVPNAATTAVFNNSLTFKGISDTPDRVIMAGAGINAAGRWSDETGDEIQVLLETSGIDNLTITAGGIINVSGVFSNNENDASIHVIATVPEDSTDQYTGTVIVGEPTPVGGILPQPRLQSNFVEIIGAELDILSDIVATDLVILRAGENAPDASRASLVLPYDVTLTGNPTTAATGQLELFSTKNIVQLASSTLTASHCVATSDNANVAALGGPWMISLGSVGNDFDTIALGMTSAPGDAANPATEGRIGVRDVDDLTVADFGILAATGQVSLEAAGALNFAAPVRATGLIGRSNESIASKAGSVMTLGALGIDLLANDTFSATSTGDVTLNGPVTVQAPAAAVGTLVSNSIQGVGLVTIAGRFQSPDAGSTKFVSSGTNTAVPSGIVIAGPVQVGGTTFNAAGTAVTVNTHDLSLISHGGTISVNNVPGNAATPYALQATNIVTLDGASNVTIGGSIVAGSIYGDPAALTATQALPSITVRGNNAIDVTATGSLRTVAYNTDPGATTNPLVGRITIVSNDDATAAATAVSIAGAVNADGAVDIGGVTGVSGSVTVNVGGSITGRESVVIRTAGAVDVSGPIASTGGTYAAAPAAGSQRIPDVLIDAGDSITTGGQGTIRAGTVTAAGATTYGTVTLLAQQNITVGAAIDTPGGIVIDSELGTFDLSALLRTSNAQNLPQSVTISTGLGMLESEPTLGRIVTTDLVLTNTGAGDAPGIPSDIDLRAKNNQFATVTATNFSVGGSILIANNAAISVAAGGISAVQDTVASTVSLASKGGITQVGAIVANNLSVTNVGTAAITLPNSANDIDNFAASNPVGNVTYNDADDFEVGVNRVKPLGIEVRGVDVVLSSTAAYSTVRVVSGLQYRSLSIGAGNATGASVGTVEFVPTLGDDNPAPAGKVPTFRGTLRDMIRYVNDNTAVYVANQTTRSQPMAMVFDEDAFPVSTITVGRGPDIPLTSPLVPLPTFKRAVEFDGGRLEAGLLGVGQTRLNITQAAPNVGQPGLPYGLSFAPATPGIPGSVPAYPGSAGSTIQHVAIYGFTQGSALLLNSGNNTVTDFYAGLDDTGAVGANNLVGLEMSGTTAVNNRIGSVVFDTTTVNRFGGNTTAGILIRGGAAGNRIYGNVIGDDTGVTPLLANGDGIRINAATGNLIGTPDEVQPDQTDSVSNVIARNKGNGVTIVNAIAGSAAAANVVRNNVIVGNKIGVAISGSKFAVLGDATGESANVIVSQAADGVAIVNSQNVQLFGNLIGVTPATVAVPTEAIAGNALNGVSITGTSQTVEISGGNRISGNTLNGIAVGKGVTKVTVAGNTIGGLLDDGTPAGNLVDGVAITAAVGNTVGVGNTISRNGGHGVSMVDARAASLATGNRIFGSTITDNASHGIFVSGGGFSTIGGTSAGDGNVIQANKQAGVFLRRSGVTGAPTSYAIQGNFVGTNTNRDVDATLGNGDGGIVVVDGAAARIEGNTVMNNNTTTYDGIALVRGTGSVIGGTTAAQGNLVANNARDGIRVTGGTAASQAATGHWISGNTIVDNGTIDNLGDPEVIEPEVDLGDGNGVTVTGRFATNITVGQSVTTAGVRGLGNAIRGSAVFGVKIDNFAQQVSVQGNSIADNLGIRNNLVGGFNYLGSVASYGIYVAAGSNSSTASTVIPITLTSATIRRPAGSQMQVLLQGTLSGVTRGQQYTIDVYANPAASSPFLPPATDPAAQATRFLGRVTVTATADGTITWGAKNPLVISANVAVGEYITASVTALRIQPGATSNLSVGRIAR